MRSYIIAEGIMPTCEKNELQVTTLGRFSVNSQRMVSYLAYLNYRLHILIDNDVKT